MAVTPFEDLVVFQKAYRISLEIHRRSLTFPKIEQYALGDQVRRASKSVCANLAEGFGKQVHSKAEFRRFLMVSLGSAKDNAGLVSLLFRSWLHRRSNLADLARPNTRKSPRCCKVFTRSRSLEFR